MKTFPEIARRYALPITALFAAAAGGVACGTMQEACLTPLAISREYPGKPGATMDDTSAWDMLVGRASAPSKLDGSDYAVIVAFKPGRGEWQYSDPISPTEAAPGIAFGRGPGKVTFGMQEEIIYPKDTQRPAACDTPPQVTFEGPMPQNMQAGYFMPHWS